MNMWTLLLPTIVGCVLATILLIEAIGCAEDRWIEAQLEYDEFEGMSEEEFASRYYN